MPVEVGLSVVRIHTSFRIRPVRHYASFPRREERRYKPHTSSTEERRGSAAWIKAELRRLLGSVRRLQEPTSETGSVVRVSGT